MVWSGGVKQLPLRVRTTPADVPRILRRAEGPAGRLWWGWQPGPPRGLCLEVARRGRF